MDLCKNWGFSLKEWESFSEYDRQRYIKHAEMNYELQKYEQENKGEK